MTAAPTLRDRAPDRACVTEQPEIRSLLDQLDVAWNSHDAEAFARLFADDADFTNVRGMQTRGRNGVQCFMAPLFATMFAGSRQRILKCTTRFLTGTLAAVDAWWMMEGARALDGLPRPTRYGLCNLVVARDSDSWRILVWHNMELSGPPPADPSAWRFVIFHNDGPAIP